MRQAKTGSMEADADIEHDVTICSLLRTHDAMSAIRGKPEALGSIRGLLVLTQLSDIAGASSNLRHNSI